MIRKTSETRPLAGNIVNAYNDSQTSAYSTEYTNECNTYSNDETFTGKYWIDGKPIYRKVIVEKIPSATTDGTMAKKDVDISSLNADMIYFENVFAFYNGTYKSMLPIPTIRFDNFDRVIIPSLYETNIELRNNRTGWNDLDIYMVVEYTKTTD